MTQAQQNTLDLSSIALNQGGHSSPEQGHCLMEVVSMFAGEKFSDAPACVDPVLRSFGMRWNDGMRTDAERDQLKQYITRLPGTAGDAKLSIKRSWMAFDWLVRVNLAAWLALTPSLTAHAGMLTALPPITCQADLDAALPHINAARDAARATARAAARDAAWAAAGDAARAAARAAAWDAAWTAARAAAWTAAWTAAGAAARAAAGAAARDALEPTVQKLQSSAHALYSQMIDAA